MHNPPMTSLTANNLDQEQELSFSLRSRDLVWWSLYAHIRNFPTHFSLVTLALLMAFMARKHEGWLFMTVMTTFIFAALEVWCLGYVLLVSILRRDKALLTKYRVFLTDDELHIETPVASSSVRDGGIHKVLELRGLVAIYLSKRQALVIPARAFASKTARERFLQSISAIRLSASSHGR